MPGRVASLGLALALTLAAGTVAAQTPVTTAPTAQSTTGPAVPPPGRVRPPVYGYEVVNVLPHDPAAFTQGLEIQNGEFLESTGRHPSSVRRVAIETGEVLAPA